MIKIMVAIKEKVSLWSFSIDDRKYPHASVFSEHPGIFVLYIKNWKSRRNMTPGAFTNRIIRFVVIKFDFIIRFVYCKLRLYKLANIIFPHVYNSNFESLSRYFEIMKDLLQKHNFTIAGKTVMELGPGTSLINAYNFLWHGVHCAILIDKYPRMNVTRRYRSYMKDEFDYFKCRNNSEVFHFIDNDTRALKPELYRFIAGDLCSIELNDKIDFIFSIAVLHHVRDLEKSINKMHELLNEGGMMFHVVDLKDKFHHFGRPFLFYKYSDFVWENVLTDDAVTYTNRVRYEEYVEMFCRHGFDIVWQRTISHERPNCRINKKFIDRTDLCIGDAWFLLKKR